MGEHAEGGQLPLTAAAQDALDASLQEAMQVGSERVEPAHLLLGVLRQRDGVARRDPAGRGRDAARVPRVRDQRDRRSAA